MAKKKLMLLGGIRYLLPVIKAAHEQGYYVITCDYLPDNIAHRYSDEYVNVSIIDQEAVLNVAREKEIDGIMSFGVDPGVVSDSYVQNQMGLPSFGPYESVCILQNKDRFRTFLANNGFNVPQAKGYGSVEEALKDTAWIPWPCIVKPTDSAGSKGVTRVDRLEDLEAALTIAQKNSISGRIIVEEFLSPEGCPSDSDSFLLNGELKFVSYSAQRFDSDAANPHTPAAFSWPSTYTHEQESELTSELQRLLTLLNMQTALFNIETRVSKGKTHIMEVTPRGGGNRLAEMIRYATGVDLITAITRYAVGDSVEVFEQRPYNGHWAEVILHSHAAGEFRGLETQEAHFHCEIVEKDLWVNPGESISSFRGANDAIGTLIVRFENQSDLNAAMSNISQWVNVITR